MHVELTKSFRFEAAHRLPLLPPDHKCFRMHGHGFEVELTLAGALDERLGWLQDYGDVTALVDPILKQELDHRTLNDVAGLDNPTSELLCLWLWRRFKPLLPLLTAVTVAETCTARCTYRGD